MIFKPGDLAVTVSHDGEGVIPGGAVVEVYKYVGIYTRPDGACRVYDAYDVVFDNVHWAVNRHALRPLPPHEKGDWEDCVWQPRELICAHGTS